jgi:cytoskeletal protein CcmA (bactofilin family)
MVELGPSMAVRGEIRTTENLTIEGQVEGLVWNDGRAVTVASGATVTGDIIARDITVLGTVSGTMVASDVVDIRETGHVTGRVVAVRFILADGSSFTGIVQPEKLHAALQVARHRLAERDIQDASDPKLDTVAV